MLAQVKTLLILAILSLSTVYVNGAIVDLINDPRTPKGTCKDWKAPKAAKAFKRRLSEEFFEEENPQGM